LHTLEHLVKQCSKGKSKAQAQLYKQFATPMFRLCFRYLENELETEEVLINGFLKIFQNIQRFDYQGDITFVAWMKRIMTNEALMFIRKHKKIYWENIEDQTNLESYEDAIQDLLAEDIYNLIRSLPLGYRTVFNLFVIEGYSHQEIAEQLNISINTSKTQLKKARNFLQQKLNTNELENELSADR
jgi:RNA polymerase sigma-70 factor (ECF subfamily)